MRAFEKHKIVWWMLSCFALFLATASLASDAFAFGRSSVFTPAIVRHGGDWAARLPALRTFAWELSRRTSIQAYPEPVTVSLDSKALFKTPFLYMSGTRAFPLLSETHIQNLRRFLDFGGFLLVDAADGSDGNGFDGAIRREIARLYPDRPLVRLPSDHVAFKTYYLLDRQAGRVAVKPFLWAILDDSGRASLIYSQNDLFGAFQKDDLGEWSFEVFSGGASHRELALRVAVNVAMYSMCLDYKSDLVHLPYLLKRRR